MVSSQTQSIPVATQHTPLFSGHLGVIGVGVMGRALVQGLLNSQAIPQEKIWATVRSEASCQEVTQTLGIATQTRYTPENLTATDCLLVCVKPNKLRSVLEKLKAAGLPESTLIISIAAGVTTRAIEKALGSQNPVVRAMPNTPCVVGQGMTVLCHGTYGDASHVAKAKTIFESVGRVMELEEVHFNAVTSLGGSGPAYLYLIMEALADGGVRVGLPRDVALKIVAQTVLGAATMVQKTGRHPAALRDDVTTPAGCTIAALLTMEDGKIRSVLARAVEEATNIAGQLGQAERPDSGA
ncbi:MAG: pyrroline-5-carboxylate reductase [Candidatus Melainabacteria bacterium]|nr:pyrroline-5-carboxylate reductase [Candidatus Melainabacteria bacterium]